MTEHGRAQRPAKPAVAEAEAEDPGARLFCFAMQSGRMPAAENSRADGLHWRGRCRPVALSEGAGRGLSAAQDKEAMNRECGESGAVFGQHLHEEVRARCVQTDRAEIRV